MSIHKEYQAAIEFQYHRTSYLSYTQCNGILRSTLHIVLLRPKSRAFPSPCIFDLAGHRTIPKLRDDKGVLSSTPTLSLYYATETCVSYLLQKPVFAVGINGHHLPVSQPAIPGPTQGRLDTICHRKRDSNIESRDIWAANAEDDD